MATQRKIRRNRRKLALGEYPTTRLRQYAAAQEVRKARSKIARLMHTVCR